MKTKDRIIEASLELFNTTGERNVTTNHIASHLNISPGNLYYHFRNKEEIIRHIFSKYADHMQTSYRAFDPVHPNQDGISLLTNYLDAVFNVLSAYSFLYDNLPVIVARDPELKQQFLKIHNKMMEKLHYFIVNLQVANVISMDTNDIDDLANIVKQQVTFWISYFKTSSENSEITDKVLYTGLTRVIILFKPYVTDEYKDDMLKIQLKYRALAEGQTPSTI